MIDTLLPWLLGAALVVFLAWPRRRLRISQVYRVSPQDLWDASVPSPARPNHFDGIERYDWAPGSDSEAIIHYRGAGRAHYSHDLAEDRLQAGQLIVTLNGAGETAEKMTCQTAIRPDPGGARLEMEIEFETLGRRGGWQWAQLLLRGLTGPSLRMQMNQVLAKSGAFDRYAAEHGAAPAGASLLGMRVSRGALLLAVVACGWWAWSFGPWLAFALVAGMVAHEAGHVAVMRAFGDRSSAFYFVPFLGGVAIGRMHHAQDWRHAAMVLGGPAAGLASALVAGALGWVLDSHFLLACAAFFAALNLFNLLPIPPLDGGQLALIALRPFMPASVLRHVGTALMGGGFLLALWGNFGLLAWVLGAFTLVALLAPGGMVPAGRAALTRGAAAGLVVASLALAALLAGLYVAITDTVGLYTLLRALVDGP
jgi:Zn-dependent protease